MTEDEMTALSYYHSAIDNPKQLDFMLQVNMMPPILDGGQYLLFQNHSICDEELAHG